MPVNQSLTTTACGSITVGEAFNPWRGACGFYVPDVVSALRPFTVALTRRKFSDGHKRLYVLLVRRWGREGPCFPSQQGMASLLGKSERTVRMWMEDLEAFGLIKRRCRGRGKGGKGQADEYTFLWHTVFERSSVLTGKNRSYDRQNLPVMTGSNEQPPYKEETRTVESRTEKHNQDEVRLSLIEETAREAAGFERLSDGDRRFCSELKGLSEETIRAGVLLGRARRLNHEVNTGIRERVCSLRYFAATIQEAAKGLPAGYVEHLENWIKRKASLNLAQQSRATSGEHPREPFQNQAEAIRYEWK